MMQSKEDRKKEIVYQTAMLNNLKKWIRNLIILSSTGVVFAYWAFMHQASIPFLIVRIVSIAVIVISVVLCIIIGLAFKNGKENVDKIIAIDQKGL